MALPYPDLEFVPLDILTAAEQNQIMDNIKALADGSGLAPNSVTSDKIDFESFASAFAPVTSTTASITLTKGTWFIIGTAVMRSTGNNLVAENIATLNGYSQVLTLRQGVNAGGLGTSFCLPSIAVVTETTKTFNWTNTATTGATVSNYNITAIRLY